MHGIQELGINCPLSKARVAQVYVSRPPDDAVDARIYRIDKLTIHHPITDNRSRISTVGGRET